jgi:hypothetical protein
MSIILLNLNKTERDQLGCRNKKIFSFCGSILR